MTALASSSETHESKGGGPDWEHYAAASPDLTLAEEDPAGDSPPSAGEFYD